jgi:hypothetical protein
MTRSLTTQDISWFLDLHEKGQLNLEPPYQRRSVWSPRDRRFFIDTILNNYPAPPVFLHKTLDENGRATYHVVDGKQRLQTIIQFTEGNVRIPDDFADVNLQKKKWRDLERATRERFWNYVLIVEMLPDVNDAAIRNTFERINRNSRKLTAQEMRHAKYEGWYISFAEAEAEKLEWKDIGVVTTARAKRMADVQFLSELFAVVIRGKLIGFDQDNLDELYAEYEDISEIDLFVEDDFTTEVERIKGAIKALIEHTPQVKDYLKVQGNVYSLWAYLHLERARLLEPREFSRNYAEFMGAVADRLANRAVEAREEGSLFRAAAEYAANLRGASTDLMPRIKRHEALVLALHGPEAAAREDR